MSLYTLMLSAAATVGCGDGATRVVSGTLDLTAMGRTGAVVVAIAEDSSQTEASVGPTGHFELEVEHGRRYAVGYRDSDRPRFFATLVNGPERRSLFEVESGDDRIEIGAVRPVEEGDDHGGGHDACRGLDPASPMDPGGAADPGIATVPMFLVVGELPLGEPTDDAPVSDDSPLHDADDDHRPDGLDDDRDGDGVCDDDDHDDDDGEHHGGEVGRSDLPYDARLKIGDRFRLTQAFLEKGPAPAAVVSVEMEGSTWRLAELQADEEFEVTQADCDHDGNRGRGRDRAFVAWRNADGSESIDHLDMRYCD